MIRQTKQRAAIEAALQQAGRPLCPSEIHALAQATYPGLGLRTVYRQIKDLTASGALVGVDYPGQPLRYELAIGQHVAHFICQACEKVFSWPADVPDVEVTAPPGFKVTGQETIFYGICPTCTKP